MNKKISLYLIVIREQITEPPNQLSEISGNRLVNNININFRKKREEKIFFFCNNKTIIFMNEKKKGCIF